MIIIPIEVSARHCHVSEKDLDTLFGKGYELNPIKDLSQHNQYAANETVKVQTEETVHLPEDEGFTFGKRAGRNEIRILGPLREHTQVELSWSDCINLALKPKVLVSGDYENSFGGIVLVGPHGSVTLKKGIIVPQRHIHANTKKAHEIGLKHGDTVEVRVIDDDTNPDNDDGPPVRSEILQNVIVRTHDDFDWQMHVDTDEGNAAGLKMIGRGEVLI